MTYAGRQKPPPRSQSRHPLAQPISTVPVLLLALGSGVAILAKWLSVVMMEDWGGRAALQAILLDPCYTSKAMAGTPCIAASLAAATVPEM